jgi:PST family polysaccharide transporter
VSSSVARKAVRGSVWVVAAGLVARGLSVVGTLLITRFLSPVDYGQVSAAAVVTLSANYLSQLGIGQYVAAHPKATRAETFHATAYLFAAGVFAAALTWLAREPLARLSASPDLPAYLPGLLLAVLLDRVGLMPERVLLREMRFRSIGVPRTLGELTFTVASIALVARGWGGHAIVAANVLRSSLRTVLMIAAADRRDWLEPHPLTRATTRKLFAFSLPMSVGVLFGFTSRNWDNLVVSAVFGPGAMGPYNLAYNLANVPAAQIGEQVGDVLLPSFARVDEDKRGAALIRATALLSLVLCPLSIGLGTISDTLVRAFFDQRWAGVGPMLTILSVLSVTRPIGWNVATYLQARNRPRHVMLMEGLKVIALLSFMLTLGRLSLLWMCGAAGVAFTAHALLSLAYVHRYEGVPFLPMLARIGSPLLACIPMALAVLGARAGLGALGLRNAWLLLGAEIVVGAIVFIPSAFVLAPGITRDFVGLAREQLARRRGRASTLPPPPPADAPAAG